MAGCVRLDHLALNGGVGGARESKVAAFHLLIYLSDVIED